MIEFQTDQLWKYIAVGLMSVAVTSLPSYIVLATKATTSQQVKQMILTHSPYNLDKKQINSQVNSNTESINQIVASLSKIGNGVSKNSGKLDTIQLLLSKEN